MPFKRKLYTDHQEKNILITGCSSGIGECVALGLHARGYRVIASARQQRDVDRLNKAGVTAIALDLSQSSSIDEAVSQVRALTQDRLYALFNNGAYGQPGALEDLPTEALRDQFETNVFGWHHLTRAFIPIFRNQGHGRIIQNSSLLGYVALKNRGAYNASKYAIEGLSDTLRLELAHSGIHVCLIEPGPISTRFRYNSRPYFFRHIDVEHSVHRDRYQRLKRRQNHIGSVQPFTLPAEAVLKRVIHILESPRPKPRYPITLPAHFCWYLKRFLPTRLLDSVLQSFPD
ncbi:MAG: SDR family oxidoreductase [Gammaproteobacteria bacterium]